ncbi:MAG: sialidase family protein, partial [Candidatus Hodarchaeales archaeon]
MLPPSIRKFSFITIGFLFLLAHVPTGSMPLETRHYTASSPIFFPRQDQEENITIVGKFSTNTLISTVDLMYEHHVEPTLAVSDNDSLFVGFKNSETHNGGGARVSFSKSTDNGDTWSRPFNMPHFGGDPSRQSDPWMFWKNGVLYYAYLEFGDPYVENSWSQITLARTSDYGANWQTTRASHGRFFADKETMAVSDTGIVYIAYDDAGDQVEIKLSRSLDEGETFHEVAVSDAAHEGHVAPYVALDGDENVYVAWAWLAASDGIGDIYLDVSTDQGATFSQEWDVNPERNASAFHGTPDGRPTKVTVPVIRFDSNNRLYLLWADLYEFNGSWDVYLRYSDDFGQTWSERLQVNPRTSGAQWMPDMDIDSEGRVHLVWLDEIAMAYSPYYRSLVFSDANRSIPTFTDPISIASQATRSNFTRPGDYLTLRVDSQDVPHVVWSDGRNNEMDIYYSHGHMIEVPNPKYAEPTEVTEPTRPWKATESSTQSSNSRGEDSSTGLTFLEITGALLGIAIIANF